MRLWIPTAVLIGIICASSLPSSAMAASSPARAEAMEKLAFMHGTWRGTASGTARDGTRYEVVQTERVGTMLDGDLLVRTVALGHRDRAGGGLVIVEVERKGEAPDE